MAVTLVEAKDLNDSIGLFIETLFCKQIDDQQTMLFGKHLPHKTVNLSHILTRRILLSVCLHFMRVLLLERCCSRVVCFRNTTFRGGRGNGLT